LLIVGEREEESNEVSVRKQGEGDKGSMKVDAFAEEIKKEIEQMLNN
jgi:threonyl-tRNA synthetase